MTARMGLLIQNSAPPSCYTSNLSTSHTRPSRPQPFRMRYNLTTAYGTPPGRALVVLAHGFLGGRIQLLPLAARLSSEDYDVLNFSYRSRADTLSNHSQSLIDTVRSRLSRKKQQVHFVTHSFGGVVLHRAFAKGLGQVIGGGSRCVLIAPPLRGAAFARAFQRERLWGPHVLKEAIHWTAKGVLGGYSGRELMMGDEMWFEKRIGEIPDDVEVMVVVGEWGRWNPLIGGVSDGVVGVGETLMRRRHCRLKVGATHNFLLYAPLVHESICRFLSGEEVGEIVADERRIQG